MRMNEVQFRMLCNLLGNSLSTKDNFARKGISTAERVALGLSVLTQSRRFYGGSADWERGKTTYW